MWIISLIKKQWKFLLLVGLIVLFLPLGVGAVTSTDALQGLTATLGEMTKALTKTLEKMIELYQAYLQSLS